ncbi:hypothetical protein HMPREF0293_2544 [Corynebacterium glucuronolyticum ATCC 51866]|uniref:Uncharacterized protein n=1 Tax=Corynebacterium glucuronolyticum ATCC 51866 TaxID=548478 RepID=A0ABP2DPW2_9CORY|nr:hypothetical protein HMPREF0293_2544 [Corynebacterium glucuronolyticum ATCC 51866]
MNSGDEQSYDPFRSRGETSSSGRGSQKVNSLQTSDGERFSYIASEGEVDSNHD